MCVTEKGRSMSQPLTTEAGKAEAFNITSPPYPSIALSRGLSVDTRIESRSPSKWIETPLRSRRHSIVYTFQKFEVAQGIRPDKHQFSRSKSEKPSVCDILHRRKRNSMAVLTRRSVSHSSTSGSAWPSMLSVDPLVT